MFNIKRTKNGSYRLLHKTVMISVLFVDDESVQLSVGKTFLERTGDFAVDTLGSGQEALASENLLRYDAIVSDYQMPGLDGIGFLQRIRSSGNTIPFILFTGKGREEIVIQALDEGAAFYVRKGGQPDALFAELGQKIRMAVHEQRDRRAVREAEIAVRENLDRYHLILKNANDGIMVNELTPHGPGKFLEANDAACRILGLTSEELRKVSLVDLDTPEMKERGPEILREIQQKRRATFQTRYKTKDNREKILEIRVSLIELMGRPTLLSVVHDITEQKRGELALQHANKKLSLMTSITRHDIRNQLLALNTYLFLSKETLEDPVKTGEYIRHEEEITNAIERQISFTKEYEDLGVMAPVWQSVQQGIVQAARELDLTGIQLTCGEMEGVEIYADSLLQKVFFNLMDNSLRHGGHVLENIRFSSHETGNGLTIGYEDDGSGIPAQDRAMIFERGYGKNSGFGLFFIREILDITGITIRECGEPGRGARFEILVPKGQYRFTRP
jgi:PAS domain S-box-containing protein